MTDTLRYKSFQDYLDEPIDFDVIGNPIPRRYSLGLFGVEIMELVWNAARETTKDLTEERSKLLGDLAVILRNQHIASLKYDIDYYQDYINRCADGGGHPSLVEDYRHRVARCKAELSALENQS